MHVNMFTPDSLATESATLEREWRSQWQQDCRCHACKPMCNPAVRCMHACGDAHNHVFLWLVCMRASMMCACVLMQHTQYICTYIYMYIICIYIRIYAMYMHARATYHLHAVFYIGILIRVRTIIISQYLWHVD